MRRLCLFPILALLATLSAFSARADERISSFASQMQLLPNGSLEVIETIKVRAEGNRIKRGISRDIFTDLSGDFGARQRARLSIISIKRDGRAEPFFTENIKDGQRVYIGQSDIFLRAGTYTYEIHYRLSRQVRFFDEEDEVFFNITGTTGQFPIDEAVGQLTLPQGAEIKGVAGVTGPFGARGEDYTTSLQGTNSVIIRSTRPFQANEGLSLAVRFNKGVVAEPTGLARGAFFLADYLPIIVPIGAVIMVLIYYLIAWHRVGIDPKKGSVIARFHPPKNVSPALAHYIHHRGFRDQGWTAFLAASVSLATKGLMRFDDAQKDTKLVAIDKEHDRLPTGEQIVQRFLSQRSSVTINKKNGVALHARKQEMIDAIETENRAVYFKNNRPYVFFGIGLSIALMVLMIILGLLGIEFAIFAIFSTVFGSAIVASLTDLFTTRFTMSKLVIIFVMGVMGFQFIPLIALTGFGVSFSPAGIAGVSLLLLNVLFVFLMRAPTLHGRKMMDEIEGFKHYMEVAEKDRMNFDDEPKLDIARYERLLPYAIALGVEKPWSDHFQAEFSRLNPENTATYRPKWHNGVNYSDMNLGGSMRSMMASASSSLAASRPTPKSSSSGFSSSGGFSGGGSGGGGVGGW